VRDETVTTRRTEEAERDAERWASIGAGALVQGGVVCDPVIGDVLHDYDWTPIEAARAVLEAVNFAGAVTAGDALADAVSDIMADEPESALHTWVRRWREAAHPGER
jgi:hypothetical protein